MDFFIVEEGIPVNLDSDGGSIAYFGSEIDFQYKFIYDKFVYTMEIQPETRLKTLPETADSLLKRGKVYRDYSFEELKELCGENEDNAGK